MLHFLVPPSTFSITPMSFLFSINSHLPSLISTSPSSCLDGCFLPPCLPVFFCTGTLYFPCLLPDSTRSSKHIWTKVSNYPPLTLGNNAFPSEHSANLSFWPWETSSCSYLSVSYYWQTVVSKKHQSSLFFSKPFFFKEKAKHIILG